MRVKMTNMANAAGYSNTPLIKKLGLTFQDVVLLINPLINYDEMLDIDFAQVNFAGEEEQATFIHWFVQTQAEFVEKFPEVKKRLAKDGMLWVSWPKQASALKSDLTENMIRELALENELVDVKVCAVDENWSGLKLVYRLANR